MELTLTEVGKAAEEQAEGQFQFGFGHVKFDILLSTYVRIYIHVHWFSGSEGYMQPEVEVSLIY